MVSIFSNFLWMFDYIIIPTSYIVFSPLVFASTLKPNISFTSCSNHCCPCPWFYRKQDSRKVSYLSKVTQSMTESCLNADLLVCIFLGHSVTIYGLLALWLNLIFFQPENINMILVISFWSTEDEETKICLLSFPSLKNKLLVTKRNKLEVKTVR